MARAKLTAEEDVTDRLAAGKKFFEMYGSKDREACFKFLDPSPMSWGVAEDQAGARKTDTQQGEYNQLTMNIMVKVAALAFTDPDFHISNAQDDLEEIVRMFLRELWAKRKWTRVLQHCLLKRFVVGLGICAEIWDAKLGVMLEAVDCWDFCCDPHINDWAHLRWCARRISMPYEDAIDRFGEAVAGPMSQDDKLNLSIEDDFYSVENPAKSVDLWVYHDLQTEAIIYGDAILERKMNPYGRLPYRFLLGDINPRSPLPLGDYDSALGMQSLLVDLYNLLWSQAKNGGGVGWFRTDCMDKAAADNLLNGRPQGFVPIDGVPGGEAIGYTPSEPMNQALLEALRMANQGIDSMQGVSEYQRGVINQNVKFATEAALLSQQSGARGNSNQKDFEVFCNDIGKDVADMTAQFGGAPQNLEESIFLQAINTTKEIALVEHSTAYKDPNFEMTRINQLVQALLPMVQLGVQFNWTALALKTLNAFGVHNPNAFIIQRPPAMMGQPGPGPPLPPTAANLPGGASIGPGSAPTASGLPPIALPNAVKGELSHGVA